MLHAATASYCKQTTTSRLDARLAHPWQFEAKINLANEALDFYTHKLSHTIGIFILLSWLERITQIEDIFFLTIMHLTVSLLCLMLYGFFITHYSRADNIFKPNLGVLFKRMTDKMFVTANHGNLMFHIKLPNLERQTKDICHPGSNDTCVSSDPLLHVLWHNEETNAQLRRDLLINIQEFKNPQRIKRGLLDFVGEASSYLFGTVSQTQLKKVYGHMAEIYDFAKRTRLNNDVIQARLRTVGQHLDSEIETISKQLHQTVLFTAEFQKILAKNQHRLDLLIKAYRWSVPNMFVGLQETKALSNWISALYTLQSHKLPRNLIPISELQSAVQALHKASNTHDEKLSVSMTISQLMQFYDTKSSVAFIIENDLYIHTRIPISFNRPLTIYQTIPLLIPSHVGDSYTKSNVPDYLAVADSGEYFMELSHTDYTACVQNAFHCNNVHMLRRYSAPSCALAIFSDFGGDSIKELCDFSIVEKATEPQIARINSTSYYIAGPKHTANMVCFDSTPKEIDLKLAQIITIPCGCAILSPLFNTLANVCTQKVNFTTSFPENFAILAHLNKSLVLTDPVTAATRDKELKLRTEQINKLIEETKASNRTKFAEELASLFQNTSDASDPDFLLYSLATSMGENWITWLVTAIIVLWATLISILTFSLWRKVRLVQFAIMSAIPAVKATPTDVPAAIATDHIIYLAYMICGLFITAFTVWLINKLYHPICTLKSQAYRYFQRFFSPKIASETLEVFLRISNTEETAVIFLAHMNYEPGQTKILVSPDCVSATINYGMPPTVNMAWSDKLKFSLNNHPISLSLPEAIIIHIKQGILVRKILQDDQVVYSVVIKASNSAYIAIPAPTEIPITGWDIQEY